MPGHPESRLVGPGKISCICLHSVSLTIATKEQGKIWHNVLGLKFVSRDAGGLINSDELVSRLFRKPSTDSVSFIFGGFACQLYCDLWSRVDLKSCSDSLVAFSNSCSPAVIKALEPSNLCYAQLSPFSWAWQGTWYHPRVEPAKPALTRAWPGPYADT